MPPTHFAVRHAAGSGKYKSLLGILFSPVCRNALIANAAYIHMEAERGGIFRQSANQDVLQSARYMGIHRCGHQILDDRPRKPSPTKRPDAPSSWGYFLLVYASPATVSLCSSFCDHGVDNRLGHNACIRTVYWCAFIMYCTYDLVGD